LETFGLIWNEGFIKPMTNGLVLLYVLLFNNFGVSIAVFTVLIRVATVPLTLKQIRATKAMSTLQPKIKELQERYKNDRSRLSQETMRLYKQEGINPIGCLGPMMIQFPIWIGLYYSLIKALPSNPESLVDLSQFLYPALDVVNRAVPLDSGFLWLDLGKSDPTPILPILVGASMWVQQKMMTFPTTDPRQRQTNQLMLWMMPLMFVFLTFQFPSGLALYWIVSNIVGMVIQYFATGWGSLLPQKLPAAEPAPVLATPVKELISDEEQEHRGGNWKDSGKSHRASAKAARRRKGRSTNRHPHSR
jgi:YidC/Oxa1 family membrane protein insertase